MSAACCFASVINNRYDVVCTNKIKYTIVTCRYVIKLLQLRAIKYINKTTSKSGNFSPIGYRLVVRDGFISSCDEENIL